MTINVPTTVDKRSAEKSQKPLCRVGRNPLLGFEDEDNAFSEESRMLWEGMIDFGLQNGESLAMVPPDRKIAQ